MTILTPNTEIAQLVSSVNGSSTNRAFSMKFRVAGLNPGNQFRLFVNNVDMTHTAKQFGKRMGSDMVSNQNGILDFEFLGELQTKTVSPKLDTIKYHTIELKDNLNITRSIAVIPQKLSGRRSRR